ncbi:hypothetical protein VTK73DRAFT_9701 [Phialemonium thermophilum]|uniref:3-keto-steroid reductase n=1 Tax=Phialemonium thermophilum TaxID=223376 RepID=A0ABR3W0T1_9PEZI
MTKAPWDSVPVHETFFVLVTGANSGIGFGICQRLVDEFLISRSLTSHLVLIPTARSAKKSQDAVDGIRRHCRRAAETSQSLRSRSGPHYDPRDTTRRVHVVSVQLDLCNFASIRDASNQLVAGTFDSPCDDGWFESLAGVTIPRLDAVIFNAGVGGWYGLDWWPLLKNFFTDGIVQATTWPKFKGAVAGLTVNPWPDAKGAADPSQTTPVLGEVFCANVFGHYILGHELLPLLCRPKDSPVPPGRIVWESSIEPRRDDFSLSDFQGIKTRMAYESSKRLTDILALTSDLPAVRPHSSAYFDVGGRAPQTPPKLYLAHPGVVVTSLFPLNAFLFFWYRLALYLARLLGSPWHVNTAYKGALAPVWVALHDAATLDAAAGGSAQRIKWGSCCDRWGCEDVKKTEVEGWGWEGKLEDRAALDQDLATGVLRKLQGRRDGAKDLTREQLEEFEAEGAECWREMERLRKEWWTDRIGSK